MTTVNAGIRLTLTTAMLWALLSLAWMHTHNTARAAEHQIGPVGFGLSALFPALTEVVDPPEAHAADLATTTEPAPPVSVTIDPEPSPPVVSISVPAPEPPPAIATPTGAPGENSATGTACSRCEPHDATP